jgi:hypothetical protein
MRPPRATGVLQPARRCHRPPRVGRSLAVARRGATAMIRPDMTAAAVGTRCERSAIPRANFVSIDTRLHALLALKQGSLRAEN